MTTVGYGDRVPRSIAGRCFSVAWIIAGIIVFNVIAGELTSAIMQAKMVGEVSMTEQRVGTLDRDYEKSLVVNHGGILIGADGMNDTSAFYSLLKNLKSGKIDGFLLDKHTYRYFKQYLLPHFEDRKLVEFFLKGTMLTNIPHLGEDMMSYGVLIKYERRYEYFKPMFESNKFVFLAKLSQFLNNEARNSSTLQDESEISNINIHLEALKDHFGFTYFLIPLGIIGLCGIAYEVVRKVRKRASRKHLEM